MWVYRFLDLLQALQRVEPLSKTDDSHWILITPIFYSVLNVCKEGVGKVSISCRFYVRSRGSARSFRNRSKCLRSCAECRGVQV